MKKKLMPKKEILREMAMPHRRTCLSFDKEKVWIHNMRAPVRTAIEASLKTVDRIIQDGVVRFDGQEFHVVH